MVVYRSFCVFEADQGSGCYLKPFLLYKLHSGPVQAAWFGPVNKEVNTERTKKYIYRTTLLLLLLPLVPSLGPTKHRQLTVAARRRHAHDNHTHTHTHAHAFLPCRNTLTDAPSTPGRVLEIQTTPPPSPAFNSSFLKIHPSAKIQGSSNSTCQLSYSKQMKTTVQMFHLITFVKHDKNKHK